MGYFVDADGQLVEGDDEAAPALQRQGYRPATRDDLVAHNARQQPGPAPAAAPAAAAPAAAPAPVDAGAQDAGSQDASIVEGYFVQDGTGEVFAGDAGNAEALKRQGFHPATRQDVKAHNARVKYGTGILDKAETFGKTIGAQVAEVAEAASKHGIGQAQDPLTGAPIGPTNIDPLTGKTRPGVAQEASKLFPAGYTQEAKEQRLANPNTAAAAVIAPDLLTALLIPGGGIGGIATSAVLSGILTEAGASAIDGDEFSVKDMMLATGGAFALEGVGSLVIPRALKALGGGPRNHIDVAIERARRAGADDALGEVDPALQGSKLRRNEEAVYERVQAELDESMNAIDTRIAEAPDAVLTPAALKRSVSGNVQAQEDVFLDLAVKLDNAVQVADEVPGLASARDVLQNTLGKQGHEMFAALNTAKRELEAIGSDSPLVQEAIEALDATMRSERTWGRAAKTYAEVADEGASPVGSWNVREVAGREALDARLDRARARAVATNDAKLAKEVKKAEKALERADKATGARLLGETTPEDVAKLKKKVEGFEKRGPQLAKELSRSLDKLKKRLGEGVIPSATEDDALDYIAARVHGLGGGRDPLKAVLKQAEEHLDAMKAKGADHIQLARAQSEVNTLREAIDEINDIPKAARRVREYEAAPARLKEKAKAGADAIVEDEFLHAIQPVLHGGGAALGGAIFGVPGYVGGYLLGRAAYKKFGTRFARYAWGKAKKNIATEAVKSPGQAVAGGIGAVGGLLLGQGSPAAVAGGFYAGRKAGELVGRGARKIFRKGKGVAGTAAKDAIRDAETTVVDAWKKHVDELIGEAEKGNEAALAAKIEQAAKEAAVDERIYANASDEVKAARDRLDAEDARIAAEVDARPPGTPPGYEDGGHYRNAAGEVQWYPGVGFSERTDMLDPSKLTGSQKVIGRLLYGPTASKAQKLMGALSKQERAVVKFYLDAGHEVSAVLRHLRDGSPLDEQTAAFVDKLDATLAKAREAGHGVTGKYYRGVKMTRDELEALRPGAELLNEGYTSLSPSQKLAENYATSAWRSEAHRGVAKVPVLFTVDVKKAVPVSPVEVLNGRGTKYSVVSVERKGSVVHAHLRENGFEKQPSLVQRAGKAVVGAVKKDPGKALGLVLAPGAAYASSQAETEGETAGAAAASAGLLLLLLPRSMGRRMAMETLTEASERLADTLPAAAVTKIARVLDDPVTSGHLTDYLRAGVRDGSERWTPEDLLNAQMHEVRTSFDAAYPGQRLHNAGPEAERYVRAELWRRNVLAIDADEELSAAYEGAVRQANDTDAYNARVAREEAAPAAPVEYPSDRARVMDRSSELLPERAQRLERSAINAVNALPQEGRDMLRSLFSRTGDELREMSQRFIDDPTSFRSAEDLLDAQAEVLRREFDLMGGGLGSTRGDAVAEAAEQAALAELQSYNAIQALRAREAVAERFATPDEPFSGSTPPRASAATTDEATQRRRLSAFELMGSHRQLADESEALYSRLRREGMEPEENLAIRAALDEADGELRAMQEAYVRGEPHMRDGEIVMNVQNHQALVQHQRQYLRDAYVAAVGVPADRVPRLVDEIIEIRVADRNAANATRLEGELGADARQTARETRRSDLERRRADRTQREEQNRLKNPDPELDEVDAIVDGIPGDAAVRLDDALQPELERINEARADTANDTPDALYEAARQAARDNPGMFTEEQAVAYAERRWRTLHDDLDAAEDLLEAGGHARLQRLPGFDEIEDSVQERLYEVFDEQVYRIDVSDEWEYNNARFDFRDFRRDVLDHIVHENPRQRREAAAWLDEQEDALTRSFDEQVAENRRNFEEENPPDSEPDPDSDYDSDPDSSPASSQRGHGYAPEDAGLGTFDELRDVGLETVEINHVEGIRNVFGRNLTLEEVRGIFSLDHLKKYAAESGKKLDTTLEINGSSVKFSGKVGWDGDFKIETTYRAGDDGPTIYYNFLHVPESMQDSGAAKELIRQMVAPLEDLGAKSVSVNTAWIGQYAWIKLGLRPDEHAERQLFEAFEDALGLVVDPGMRGQAVPFVMNKIKTARDVADTYLPMDLVKDRLPELRQGWAELMTRYSASDVKTIPFEEACFRTSRSGNQQFLAGKYFLLTKDGSWNNGLKLDVQPGAPWYDEFKGRLGLMGAGVGALSMYELIGAFQQTEMSASRQSEADAMELPPEVEAYVEQQREKDEQVENTRSRLGYLKTQGETLMQTAARALANRTANERTVQGIPGVTTNQGIKSFMGSNSNLREAYEEKRETLEKLKRDPMLLVDELTEGLAELQDTAPELHAKMVAQTYKIVSFLQSKVPGTIGASLARPAGSPPNDIALKQFALYYSAATDPGSVLGDLANNRSRREQVDTLKEVWHEEVYVPLKAKIAAEMASGRPTVNQRIRLDLQFDFGDSLDAGMSSRLLAVAAESEAKAKQGAQEAGGVPDGGAPGKVPGRRSQPSVVGTSATASLSMGAARGV